MYSFFQLLACTALATAIAIPQQINSHEPLVGNGGAQAIPALPKAPGTFFKDAAKLNGEPPDTANTVPDVYGPREIDLPFARLFNGNLHFYKTLNNPASNTSTWGSQYDNADQSACGIPANAFFNSGVAISPYFIKYAGLDRYCMQDVCISFWSEDGSSDMMLKVTDICTPDSADGIPCTDPMDIKIDRNKARVIFHKEEGVSEKVLGDTYPEKVWWFFAKCWDDGLAQPSYQNNSNWFTKPYLPNNLLWAQDGDVTQHSQNQKTYPVKGWETYPNGAYNTTRVAPPILDYDPENLPAWSPIAGGKGSSLKSVPVPGSEGMPANSIGMSTAIKPTKSVSSKNSPGSATSTAGSSKPILILADTTSTTSAAAEEVAMTTSSSTATAATDAPDHVCYAH